MVATGVRDATVPIARENSQGCCAPSACCVRMTKAPGSEITAVDPEVDHAELPREGTGYVKVSEDPVEPPDAKKGGCCSFSRAARCCCCFFCILAVIVVVLTVWRLKYLEGICKDNLLEESEATFGTNCTVDDLKLSVLFARSSLIDYGIGNPPEYLSYKKYFVTLDRVVFDLNLMTLWPDNKVEIQDLRMEGFDVDIIVKDLKGHANIKTIYDFVWSQPWHFKHLKIKAKEFLMTDIRIRVYRPRGVDMQSTTLLDPVILFKIDKILVPDIGENSTDGGVSYSGFIKIWGKALWNGILHNAPDPLTKGLLQAVNVAMEYEESKR